MSDTTDKNSTENANNAIRQTPVENEDTWVFESLVGFLTGLIWNIPMDSFIEHKSLVFEPDEDHPEEYHKIHEEYKNMVDMMLTGFMQDLGITAKQFEKACNYADVDIKTAKFKQELFEQIWAAEDYDVFVKMMIQRNTELQLQALESIKGSTSGAQARFQWARKYDDDENELQEALRQSFEEHQQSIFELGREEDDVDKVLKTTMEEERNRLEAAMTRDRRLLEQAIQLSLNDKPSDSPQEATVEEVKNLQQSQQINPPDIKSAESISEPVNVLPKSSEKGISAEDIERRRTYLLLQRDKLLSRKQEEQKKQLQIESSTGTRPKSAQLARSVLDNQEKLDGSTSAQMLAARRALAARLKAEVVGKD